MRRGNIHGAALFSILASGRSMTLLRLLVAYQVMWDFLDSASESALAGEEIGRLQLHTALVDAFEPALPMRDYYLHDAREGDAGYLCKLVRACRQHCLALDSFERVRPFLVVDATRAGVRAVNHDSRPAPREAKLREWVARELPDEHEASWFELAAAAGASLSIFALLALAADADAADEELHRLHRIYWPWASTLATMHWQSLEDARNPCARRTTTANAVARGPALADLP
ncbi:MAG TPA: DUF2600 family protein [Solirubrobacteraceae bacterium]|nr:DUF2600 family protein [Solirubrobacteraceae bacterium]